MSYVKHFVSLKGINYGIAKSTPEPKLYPKSIMTTLPVGA